MNGRKSSAIAIFIGVLLIVVFAVGLIVTKNPSAFQTRYRYDYTLESVLSFCAQVWLPAGIIGIPLFLVSLIISLVRESRKD